MGFSRSRVAAREGRRVGRKQNHDALIRAVLDETPRKPAKPNIILKPLTPAQRLYDKSLRNNIITFGTGPAGTGKTWYATMFFADLLKNGEIEKLIITRPAVEAGESLGFLPGELEEKFDPYFRPLRDALVESLGAGRLDYLIKAGTIEARPLGLLRGSTFKNCAVIFDESQNSTISQMKMFLTRIGEDCRVAVNGDTRQKDITGHSGLIDACRRVTRIEHVGHIAFTKDDVVRSGICQKIVSAYEDDYDMLDAGLDNSGLEKILRLEND